MSIKFFSPSNCGLLLISAGLLMYFFFLWQYSRQKATPGVVPAFQKPVMKFATAFGLYFVLLCVLAGTGFFTVITMPPRFLLIFLPMLLIVILLCLAKLNGALQFLSILPPVMLISVQVMRIFIELLFLQFANEKIIPDVLSLHGRNYDFFIGVLAIPVSLLFIRNHTLARKAGMVFNVLGLISLVNIFSIAIPSLPSTFRMYDTLHLPTYFPGVLIVFLASSALYLHVLSLRQLLALKEGSVLRKTDKTASKTVLQSA